MLLIGSALAQQLRVLLVLLLWVSLILGSSFVCAEKDSNPYPWGDNPNNHAFQMYWNDARNVLQDLDKFQALYIKYHGCVWSECSRGDNFDDDGENRDGDEYWYQYRTQPFCGNAAFSLYGVLKNHFLQLDHCSRGTYINSFFTYGGADTLMEALHAHVSTVFDEKDGNDNNNNNGNYEKHSNADCYDVENEQRDRALNSNDNNGGDNDISTTMGCSAQGAFVVALFEGTTCDGNYYLGTSDSSDSDMSKYNRKMNSVRCRQIWNRFTHSSGAGTYNRQRRQQRKLEEQNDDNSNTDDYYEDTYNSPAEYLLSHSWACDVSLYPNGLCPDPYGLKNKYDAVLQAVASGRSAKLAVWQVRLHTPIVFLATLLLLAACVLWGLTYYALRHDEAKTLGTWRPVLGRDLLYFCRSTVPRTCRKTLRLLRRACRTCLRWMPLEMRKRRHNDNDENGDEPSRASSSRRSRRKFRGKANVDDNGDDANTKSSRRSSSRRRGSKDQDEEAARRPSSRRRGDNHPPEQEEQGEGGRPSSRRRGGDEAASARKNSKRSSRRRGKQDNGDNDDNNDDDNDGSLSRAKSPKSSRRRDRRTAVDADGDDDNDGNFMTPYMRYAEG